MGEDFLGYKKHEPQNERWLIGPKSRRWEKRKQATE